MALVCDTCGTLWGADGRATAPVGLGWWCSGRSIAPDTAPTADHLARRRDFCSEECLSAFYRGARPPAAVPTEATTQRLPAVVPGLTLQKARH